MSPTILPEIVRCNLRPLRRALDEYEGLGLTPEQADAFFFLCTFLADAIEKNWARIQGSSPNGIEGRKLSTTLQDVSGQIAEALQTYERLQRMAKGMTDYRGVEGKLSRLSTERERVEQVRQQLASLLALLSAPPPLLDLEKLMTLEGGPFIRLEDLRARRRSQGS